MPTPFLSWQDRFETGNLPYDDQHRALLALLNQMGESMQHWGGREEARLQLRFETFAELLELHSRMEDLLMHRFGHGTAADHAEMHRSFLAEVKAIAERGDFGPRAHPAILEVLGRFKAHFEGEDEQRLLHLLRAAG